MASKIKADQFETLDGSGNITLNNSVTMASTKTLPAASLTGALPAISGASLTSLNATNLGSGTVPTARLGSGTANTGVFLRGDGSWQAAGSTSASDLTSGTLPMARLSGTLPALNASALTAIPAANITGTLPAISGASLTNVNAVNTGRKNILINGDMQVWQRATAATAAVSGFQTVDRWKTYHGSDGAYTLEQSVLSVADRATTGCTNALLAQCTTADASLGADQYAYIVQPIEAQNLSHIKYGTSDAIDLTLSFWVKKGTIANGSTFSVALKKFDSSYFMYQQYTIDSDNWEYKTLTYPGLTAAGITTSDNTVGMEVRVILASGSNYQGTVNTWSTNATEQASSSQFNFLSNTSNDFYITGVQLEVGSVATDFEHRSYGEELTLCHRYYERFTADASAETLIAIGFNVNTTTVFIVYPYKQLKRVVPSFTSSGASHFERLVGAWGAGSSISCQANMATARLNLGGFASATAYDATEVRITTASNGAHWFAFDSEL